MQLTPFLLTEVLPLASWLVEATSTPEPEDVKAGWTGFGIFLGLVAAVALLAWALTRQLRTTERNRRAGVFGPVPPEEGEQSTDGAGPATGSTGEDAGVVEEIAEEEGHRPGEDGQSRA